MSRDLLVQTVRSTATGTYGRTLNSVGAHHFVLDGAHLAEEVSTVDAFLVAVAVQAVSPIERVAGEAGLPLQGVSVEIEARRPLHDPGPMRE